jgi:AmmeMemoRadiSam system protein A
LLALARTSIEAALRRGGAYVEPQLQDLPADLLAPRSSFVTLRIDGELRGCIGTLEAPRPLGEDVWRNAHAAAFSDPRFQPLTPAEWRRCGLHISVLTTPERMTVESEHDLLRQLRVRVDGLILELGAARVTFLPAVWDLIDEPAVFLRQLKLKAGWRPDFWSPEIRVWRYEAENFGED